VPLSPENETGRFDCSLPPVTGDFIPSPARLVQIPVFGNAAAGINHRAFVLSQDITALWWFHVLSHAGGLPRRFSNQAEYIAEWKT
jgi:hypothetical protein